MDADPSRLRKPPFLIGTSGWTYDNWKGVFYPDGLAKNHWLDHYAMVFPTVEVNATFYRPFADKTYENWRERVPVDFKYVLKVPRTITHEKYLKDVVMEIHTFWHSATLLGDKLGLVLLQVAPQTKYDPALLRSALQTFDDRGASHVAVEFRQRQWLNDEIRALLAEFGAVFVSVDSPDQRLLDWVTSETAYLRLHGRRRWYEYDYSSEELEDIAKTARRMADQGARTIYIFFNNDYHANAPRNALALA